MSGTSLLVPAPLSNAWGTLSRRLRLRRTRRKPKVTNEPKTDDHIADEPESPEDLAERIDELEQEGYTRRATIKRLQDIGKTVIGQREQWKARALAVEEQTETERGRYTSGQDRFDILRRIIVKQLHPDSCTGGDLERLMRQKCFKKLWPEIERLAEKKWTIDARA